MDSLTEKCKSDFKKWLKDNYDGEKDVLHSYDMSTTYELFRWFPDSAKSGLVQDFADSVGYYIAIGSSDGELWYCNKVDKELFKSRAEARTEAVKQFNRIYNG